MFLASGGYLYLCKNDDIVHLGLDTVTFRKYKQWSTTTTKPGQTLTKGPHIGGPPVKVTPDFGAAVAPRAHLGISKKSIR